MAPVSALPPRQRIAALFRMAVPRRRHLEVALADLRARLAGYCNHCPNNGALDQLEGSGGGYRHWRCGRRRGHTGSHRGLNYIWPVPRRASGYRPINTAEDRAAEVAADTVDADPLPPHPRGARGPMHDTYAQQWRGLAWQQRDAARRGWGPPTPGQVLGLLRHPRATVAALGHARRLDEYVTRLIKDGARLPGDGDTDSLLINTRDYLAKHLDTIGVPR